MKEHGVEVLDYDGKWCQFRRGEDRHHFKLRELGKSLRNATHYGSRDIVPSGLLEFESYGEKRARLSEKKIALAESIDFLAQLLLECLEDCARRRLRRQEEIARQPVWSKADWSNAVKMARTWEEVDLVRRMLAHLERAAPAGCRIDGRPLEEWIRWAKQEADNRDPTSVANEQPSAPRAHTPD